MIISLCLCNRPGLLRDGASLNNLILLYARQWCVLAHCVSVFQKEVRLCFCPNR